LVFVVPTIGMAGAAEFAMLAAVAEGLRVLAKGCGRQWGAAGVTVNTVAAAPHHWLDAEVADALTRGISLSTPAFGGAGAAADDLAPLIAALAAPDTHFLTAATLVADGGTWVGL
jgi:3-oxoacyl-[acyl-carrier protein] reductase